MSPWHAQSARGKYCCKPSILIKLEPEFQEDMSRTEDLTAKFRTLSYDHERMISMCRAANERAANAERETNLHKIRLTYVKCILLKESSLIVREIEQLSEIYRRRKLHINKRVLNSNAREQLCKVFVQHTSQNSRRKKRTRTE